MDAVRKTKNRPTVSGFSFERTRSDAFEKTPDLTDYYRRDFFDFFAAFFAFRFFAIIFYATCVADSQVMHRSTAPMPCINYGANTRTYKKNRANTVDNFLQSSKNKKYPLLKIVLMPRFEK